MNTKEYYQKYYLEHKEHMLELAKRSRNNRLKSDYKRTNEKAREYNKKYRTEHREWFLDQQRKDRLKYTFGITIQQYNEMFEKQNGCCAICGKHQNEFKKALYIDHNHTTNEIRGLLCYSCNSMLGFAKDNIEILTNAIAYLEVKE